tara:strand:- start:889 stop:1131 length:243 start_codon:yes stop_codon:yes gene_type:complete
MCILLDICLSVFVFDNFDIDDESDINVASNSNALYISLRVTNDSSSNAQKAVWSLSEANRLVSTGQEQGWGFLDWNFNLF